MANITCPEDCTSSLPNITADLCNPDINFGQIDKIYMCQTGNPFDDVSAPWTDKANWDARIDNAGTLAGDIHYLHVLGEKPAPETNKVEISLRRKVQSPKKHSINFKVDETGDLNYEFLRKLECGGVFLVWYQAGKYLYGGNEGIAATISLDDVIPESSQDVNQFVGAIEWEDQFHPDRIVNPLN